VEQCEVVHVTQVRRLQDVLDVVIEAIEVDLREELAREVADRQAAASLERREEIVTREVVVHRLLGVRAVHDRVDEPKRRRADAPPAEVVFQDLVIDRREVAVDVASQHVAMAVPELLIAGHRAGGCPWPRGCRSCLR
jgi:hypothetical protein